MREIIAVVLGFAIGWFGNTSLVSKIKIISSDGLRECQTEIYNQKQSLAICNQAGDILRAELGERMLRQK